MYEQVEVMIRDWVRNSEWFLNQDLQDFEDEMEVIPLIFDGNYARSSQLFESGFSGFIGLTITSLDCVGRLLLNGAFISRPPADVLHIGEKKGKK